MNTHSTLRSAWESNKSCVFCGRATRYIKRNAPGFACDDRACGLKIVSKRVVNNDDWSRDVVLVSHVRVQCRKCSFERGWSLSRRRASGSQRYANNVALRHGLAVLNVKGGMPVTPKEHAVRLIDALDSARRSGRVVHEHELTELAIEDAIEAEREACAIEVETQSQEARDTEFDLGFETARKCFAATIRAREG